MSFETPLNDELSVIHLATGIAGAYCTKLLVDGGATATRLEPPEGDALRRRSASLRETDSNVGGVLFQYLAASTRSVTIDVESADDREAAWSLIEAADIVVWSRGSSITAADEFAPGRIRARAPRAVVVTITPFGLVGEENRRPANEFTLQAMSAGWVTRGRAEREPLAAGGDHGDWVAGTFAALAGLAAWWRVRDSGEGELVDLSALDTMHLTQSFFGATYEAASGAPFRSARAPTVPLNHPTKDGYVGFQITTGQQWLDFCVMVERPDWSEDATLFRHGARSARYEEMNAHIDSWTSERTTAEVIEFASALRLPVAPINNGETLTKFEQSVARGWYRENPYTGFLQPNSTYMMHGEVAPRPTGPAPKLGEHNGEVTTIAAARKPAAPVGETTRLPFEGLRIVDFTAFWAGPIITHFFAILGADVIHMESVQRPDGIRAATVRTDMGDGWWEASPAFTGANTNKRDLTLNMSLPRGRELALKLIAEADIVVENFSSRVFEHWGFDYETLRSINPRLIMARASGFGNSGPWRDHVAYATTVEQGSGLAWVTGYADDRPEVTGGACDPIAGSHTAFALLLGLEYRRRTGKGLLIETPQFTTGLSLSAEQVIEYSSSGTLLGRDTNRSWVYAPQGAYRTADYTPPYDSMPPDDWIAISITSDEEWFALCRVIGASELAADPELASVQGRMRRHDEIDAVIGAWARPLQADSAVAALIAAGVPASRFIGMAGLDAIPEVKARGLYEEVDQPVLGRVPVIGYPAKFEKGPHRTHRTPAPTLGQHNREILEGILGLSPAEIDELEAENIIGVKPKMGTAW